MLPKQEDKIMERQLRIEVRDSLIDPDLPSRTSPTAHWFKGENGKTLYKVWIYLVGDDLPYVENVVYKLHPTFANRVRKVQRTPSNPNCQLVIWTWGIFEVGVEINDKSGNVYGVSHNLTYARQIEQGSIEFVEEQSLPSSRQPQLKRSRSSWQ